jgi:hypothetical protein
MFPFLFAIYPKENNSTRRTSRKQAVAPVLGGVVIILFLSFYLSANPDPVVGWITRLSPPYRRAWVREILSAVRSGLLGWLKGQLAAMVTISVLWAITLFLVLLGAVGALGKPLLATVMFLGFFRYGLNGIYELTSSAGLQTASGIIGCLIFALSLACNRRPMRLSLRRREGRYGGVLYTIRTRSASAYGHRREVNRIIEA